MSDKPQATRIVILCSHYAVLRPKTLVDWSSSFEAAVVILALQESQKQQAFSKAPLCLRANGLLCYRSDIIETRSRRRRVHKYMYIVVDIQHGRPTMSRGLFVTISTEFQETPT